MGCTVGLTCVWDQWRSLVAGMWLWEAGSYRSKVGHTRDGGTKHTDRRLKPYFSNKLIDDGCLLWKIIWRYTQMVLVCVSVSLWLGGLLHFIIAARAAKGMRDTHTYTFLLLDTSSRQEHTALTHLYTSCTHIHAHTLTAIYTQGRAFSIQLPSCSFSSEVAPP